MSLLGVCLVVEATNPLPLFPSPPLSDQQGGAGDHGLLVPPPPPRYANVLREFLNKPIVNILSILCYTRSGGGGHPPLNWVGGAAGGGGGWKPDPVSNRSAHKKYTLSHWYIFNSKNFHMHTRRGGESFAIERWFKVRWYSGTNGLSILLCIHHHKKAFIKICCVPHTPSLVPRSRACHKHCGLW